MLRHTVLVVEEEPALARLLHDNFEREGFAVREAGDGEAALLSLCARKPDVALLDWTLPRLSGLDLCREIRRSPAWRDLPLIMLTRFGEERDRVMGLDSGADDCVVKPFSSSELVARVRALMRRASPAAVRQMLRCGDLAMDLSAHRVTRGSAAVYLSPMEFRLLRFFLERPDQVFSREELLHSIWGGVDLDPRTVDVHIRRLRRALNVGRHPDLIRTVRTAGYALDVGDGAARSR
jgi:two-component system, OmpR family, phosphate regulon response regulator PhoB